MMINEYIEYITVEEAAKHLNRTKTNVCWLCRKGKLKGAKKFGEKVWMIPKQSVLEHKPGLQGFAAVQARKKADEEKLRSLIRNKITQQQQGED